jgi:RNA polymerase sigma-70 factor (ECF subfamily)
VRDRGLAEDLVQETLLRGFEKLRQLRDPERFPGWLSRIALNACRMHLRQRLSRPAEISGEEAISTSKEPDAEPPLGVDQALGQLDAASRRLLALFYTEELSHEELAEVFALSASAVKSRLHRARERLRREMLAMMSDEQKARLGVPVEKPAAAHTVLLVEPEEGLREALRQGLTKAGYRVLVLPTGEAALEAIKERKGRLLILDKHCVEPHWLEVMALVQVDAWSREHVPIGVIVDAKSPPADLLLNAKNAAEGIRERDLLLAWQGGAAFCLHRPPEVEEVVRYVGQLTGISD